MAFRIYRRPQRSDNHRADPSERTLLRTGKCTVLRYTLSVALRDEIRGRWGGRAAAWHPSQDRSARAQGIKVVRARCMGAALRPRIHF